MSSVALCHLPDPLPARRSACLPACLSACFLSVSVHQSICPFVRLSFSVRLRVSVCSSVRPSVLLSVRPYVRLSVCNVRLSLRCVRLFVRPSHMSVCPSVCPSVSVQSNVFARTVVSLCQGQRIPSGCSPVADSSSANAGDSATAQLGLIIVHISPSHGGVAAEGLRISPVHASHA